MRVTVHRDNVDDLGAGTDERPVRPVDLAPTLAGLARIPYPSDLDGIPLIPGGN